MSHLDLFIFRFIYLFLSLILYFPQETEKGVENRQKSVNCIGILEMTSPVAWKTSSKKSQGKEWEMTGKCQDCNNNQDYSQQNPAVLICYMNFTTEEKGQLTPTNFIHSRFCISAPKVLPMLSLNSPFVSSVPRLLLTTPCSALSTSFLPTV